jgi:tetratricopeptide (TPR) repeat protein
MMIDENIISGILAARSGNFKEASNQFTIAVKNNPQNEDAWLYLGHVLTQPDRREYCYRQVLRINPSHETARISMEHLRDDPQKIMFPEAFKPPIQSKQTNTYSPAVTNTPPATVSIQQSAISPKIKRKARPFWGGFKWGFAIIVVIISIPMAFQILRGDADVVIEGVSRMKRTFFGPSSDIDTTMMQFTSAAEYYMHAKKLLGIGEAKRAIPYLKKTIELAPEHDEPYYDLASILYIYSIYDLSMTDYYAENELAKTSMDKAIELQPYDKEYYYMRAVISKNFSINVESRANRIPILRSAEQDIRQAMTLMDDDNYYTYYHNLTQILNLSGQCGDTLAVIEDMEKQIPNTMQVEYAAIQKEKGIAFACLGDLQKANQFMEESKIDRTDEDEKVFDQALYAYMDGRLDESLQIVNELINRSPTFWGKRYYLRAAIEIEQGNMDAAREDIGIGEKYTWDRIGFYSYVQAQIALADGDTDAAISWLQRSEATCEAQEEVLREKALSQLLDLGGEPIKDKPTYFFPGVDYSIELENTLNEVLQ